MCMDVINKKLQDSQTVCSSRSIAWHYSKFIGKNTAYRDHQKQLHATYYGKNTLSGYASGGRQLLVRTN